MKMWICRDQEGLAAFIAEPKKYYPNPSDENDYWWIASGYDEPIMLNQNLFPEVTLENSPMEVELKIKHNEMRFSPMFRLFDRIVIKDPSDIKRIVKYTEKLIDKLKEEGFYADAKCAEEYLKVFNGELVELVIKKKEQD